MQRLRSTWLALAGGALLVALSVSVAFGAPPTGDEAPRGRTVASFVHELVFGPHGETDDEVVEGDENESETDTDEEAAAEEFTEDVEQLDASVAEELEGEFANHGECVSEEASDKTDENPEEDGNHGAVVSLAAQEACWDALEDPEDTEEDTEDELEDEVTEEDETDFANHGECVSSAAHDWEGYLASDHLTHGKWVSEHARELCWEDDTSGDEEEDVVESSIEETDEDVAELTVKEERKAVQAVAREQRKAEADAAKAVKASGRGSGQGRGGGRP